MADKLICIDAGHGGKAPGAIGFGFKEKDLNLKIAKELVIFLRNFGYKTLESRPNDVDVPLGDRCRIANRAGANLFVSIHCNSSSTGSPSGIEVFSAENSTGGARFSKAVNDELKKLGRKDRGTKISGFYVLRYTQMVSILVECGFISNKEEVEWISANTKGIAEKIAKGIKNYLGGN
jgi:N-acetylmuramoyl-L-alanine amidase